MGSQKHSFQSAFRFLGIRAQGSNRAFGAARLFGEADAAAVVLEQVAETNALLFRNQPGQVEFDFVGVGIFRESQALREAHDMCVDADGLSAEGVAKEDVSGFSPDARKSEEIFQAVGHLPTKALDDFVAAIVNRARLVAEKIDLPDLFLELLHRSSGIVFGGFILFKEFDGYLVHKIVARLGGQDQSDEKFERVGEVEIEFSVGMDLFESVYDPFDTISLTNGF